MAIMIGENYKLGADKLNIILYKKFDGDPDKVERGRALAKSRYGDKIELESFDDGEDKAEKGWRVEGYFSTLAWALKHLIECEIRREDIVDLQKLVDKVQTYYDLVDRVCPNITVSLMMNERKSAKTKNGDELKEDEE